MNIPILRIHYSDEEIEFIKDEIEKALIGADIDIGARPEDLSLDEFSKIEDAFYKKGVRL